MKPRFGLIRGREFLMKDLYSFDVDEKSALETYGRVCQAYEGIFKRIGVNFIKGKIFSRILITSVFYLCVIE